MPIQVQLYSSVHQSSKVREYVLVFRLSIIIFCRRRASQDAEFLLMGLYIFKAISAFISQMLIVLKFEQPKRIYWLLN
jgi:hypothetical protein